MTYRIKCPICNNKIKAERYIDENYITVEEYVDCHYCGYYYQFSYGSYIEVIANKKFIWNYKTYNDNNAFHRLNKQCKRAAFMASRNWKKGIKKKYQLGGNNGKS